MDKKGDVYNYSYIEFCDASEVDKEGKYLHKTKTILDKMGLKWCCAFGTALGLYRDGRYIPQDTDIDVMIFGCDKPMDVAMMFCDDFNLVRTVKYLDEFHQIALQAEDRFIIDLCFFYEEDGYYTSLCEGGYWKDAVETIGEPRLVTTDYGEFPLPERTEEYLETRYGKDWRIPRYGDNACSVKEEM